MKKGCFIVFEGIDGAGKSTQARLLSERLEGLGRRVVMTAEPTDLASGRELRRVLRGEVKKSDCEIAAMFTLDRIAHNTDADQGIEALLSEGACIICDRYYYSTLAYQGSVVDYGWVKAMNTICPEIRHPDVCIFLDLTPEQSMKRISVGRDSVEIYENEETLARVRDTFMKVIEDMRETDRIEIVDASGEIEKISDRIFEIVEAVL